MLLTLAQAITANLHQEPDKPRQGWCDEDDLSRLARKQQGPAYFVVRLVAGIHLVPGEGRAHALVLAAREPRACVGESVASGFVDRGGVRGAPARAGVIIGSAAAREELWNPGR